MKKIDEKLNHDCFTEDVSQYLKELQIHRSELERAKLVILNEREKIRTMVQSITEIIQSNPTSADIHKTDISSFNSEIQDEIPIQEIIEILHDSAIALLLQYRQLFCNLNDALPEFFSSFQENEKSKEIPVIPTIKKIPIYVIHEDIYILMKLIHRFTTFEYFNVHPFFSLASAQKQISSETGGGILISEDVIRKDPLKVIRSFREKNIKMPIIVMDGCRDGLDYVLDNDKNDIGIIKEGCSQEELIEVIFHGLLSRSISLTSNS